MGDYGYLIALGVVAVIAVIAGFMLRPKGRKKKPRAKKSTGKKKDAFYKPDDYQDTGGGGGEWQDSNLYDMKEGSGGTGFVDDDYDPKKKKKEKYESWDDY